MIKIDIWIHPGGDETKKRLIGEGFISNDGTGTEARGNYSYTLKTNGKKVRSGHALNFPRKRRGVWSLLCKILTESVMDYV